MNANDLDEVARVEAGLQSFPWTRGNFADSLAAGYSVWVLRVGGQLLGFSIVMLVLDEAHLLNIGVSASHQGKGYGARLLRNAMAIAKCAVPTSKRERSRSKAGRSWPSTFISTKRVAFHSLLQKLR